jgi:large subunit ribosomal protein L27
MSHTKAGGKTKNGRDSSGKRLGIKLYAGQPVHAGQIIVRQRGSRWHAGVNVKRAKDDTLYAAVTGVIAFKKMKQKTFYGSLNRRTYVSVHPETA